MNRRMVLASLLGAVLFRTARAQQRNTVRQVGVLFPGVMSDERERLLTDGLASELGEGGATFVFRSAEGDNQRLAKLAEELAAIPVDVIVAIASGGVQAARKATRSIPIVALDLETDPIASGVAESLNRPGGNLTGIFFDAPEIAGKWIQVLKEPLPHVGSVGLLYDAHLDLTQLGAGESAARGLGIATTRLGIAEPSQLADMLRQAAQAKVDAVLVHSSPLFVD